MNVIGATLLWEHGAKHPDALPALRAFYALVSQADWTERSSVERECGAISRFKSDRRMELELNAAACRVSLCIHYELSLVRILAVLEAGKEEAR